MRPLVKPRVIVSILLASMTFTGLAADGPPEVKEYENGWYKQRFEKAGVAYLVDKIGRTCFAATKVGMAEIPCRTLKRRAEWAAVISWEKAVKSSY